MGGDLDDGSGFEDPASVRVLAKVFGRDDVDLVVGQGKSCKVHKMEFFTRLMPDFFEVLR